MKTKQKVPVTTRDRQIDLWRFLTKMKTRQKVPVAKLSISVPEDLKPLIWQRAKSQDLTVSQYIRKLVNEDGKSP